MQYNANSACSDNPQGPTVPIRSGYSVHSQGKRQASLVREKQEYTVVGQRKQWQKSYRAGKQQELAHILRNVTNKYAVRAIQTNIVTSSFWNMREWLWPVEIDTPSAGCWYSRV